MSDEQSRTIWQHFYRLDSVIYTLLGSAGIGAMIMGTIPHTVMHGAVDAFTKAALLGGVTGVSVGAVARLVTAAVTQNRLSEASIRWTGNVFAFLAAPVLIPTLALA